MGGRIETATAAGQGTSFKLVLPLTTAVTQVVMLRCGESTRRRAVDAGRDRAPRRRRPRSTPRYASGAYEFGDQTLPFFWLGALLQLGSRPGDGARAARAPSSSSAAPSSGSRVHVDEVARQPGSRRQEPRPAAVAPARPGRHDAARLGRGRADLQPGRARDALRRRARAATLAPRAAGAAPLLPSESARSAPAAPLVLVVDDSLTVRRVTQRLLVREGYRVTLAKDGLDALERLAEELPQVMLSDIEMPRMDGFDLVRNIRADARWRDLPVIMITSRIAQKHRDHATELGVDHYLGKPYSEEDLLALIARYIVAAQAEA